MLVPTRSDFENRAGLPRLRSFTLALRRTCRLTATATDLTVAVDIWPPIFHGRARRSVVKP